MLKKIMSFIKKAGDLILDKFAYVRAMNHFEHMQIILNKEGLSNPMLIDDIEELKKLKILMEKYRDEFINNDYMHMSIDSEYDIYMFYKSYEYLLTKRLIELLVKEKNKYKL